MPILKNYALRALDNAGAFEGRLVAFTGPHLRDSFDQWFDSKTDFGWDMFPADMSRPVDYHHSRGNIEGLVATIGPVETRSDGLYTSGQLNPDHPSYDFVWEKLQRGELGFSIATLPTLPKFASSGHVERFPFPMAAITPSPSAPKRLTTVAALRASGVDIDGEGEVELTVRSVLDLPDAMGDTPQAAAGQTVTYRLPPAARTPQKSLQGASQRGFMQMTDPLDQPDLGAMVSLLGLRAKYPALFAHSRSEALPDNFEQAVMARFLRALDDDRKKPAEQRKYMQRRILPNGDILPSDYDLVANAVRGRSDGWGAHLRANEVMNTGQANYGAEWIFTAWNTQVWHDLRELSTVFGLIPQFKMPSKSYDYPYVASYPTVQRVSEVTAQTSMTLAASPYTMSKFGTEKITFAILDGVGGGILLSEQQVRWSQIDMLTEAMRALGEQMAIALDMMLLHGDETATTGNISHYGTDPSATAYNHYLLVNGLRHIAIGAGKTSSASGIGVNASYIMDLRRLMGYLGRNPADLIILVDEDIWYDMIEMDEVKTLDAYGDMATLVKGELGRLWGSPIIPTDRLELTNASGYLEDSHDGTLSQILAINPKALMLGVGYDATPKRGDVPYSDAHWMVQKAEFDVQQMQAGAVAYKYNIG